MRLLISGPPSCGKSTQGRRLAGLLGVPHVSSGDLIRAAAKSGDPEDVALLALVSDGSLAPSGPIAHMVARRLSMPDCADGFVLDGFPRKRQEASFLAVRFPPAALIVMEAAPAGLIARVARRASEGRADDDPVHFPRRIAAFESDTRDAHRELESHGIPLHRIRADGGLDETSAMVDLAVAEIQACLPAARRFG